MRHSSDANLTWLQIGLAPAVENFLTIASVSATEVRLDRIDTSGILMQSLHFTQWRQRGLVVYYNRPYYPTTRFRSSSSHLVSVQSFLDRPRPMSCKSAQTVFAQSPSCEPRSQHVPTNRIQRRTETTSQSRWWHSHGWNLHRPQHSRNETKLRFILSNPIVRLSILFPDHVPCQ